MPDYISIKNVDFAYGDYGGELVLDNVSLSIEQGEFVSVIGPSGCGKSTLLRLLAGLIFPQKGAVAVDGSTVTGPGLDRAVVFQDYSLFPWMNCRDNVALALEQAGIGDSKRERARIAENYIEMVDLRGAGRKLPGELSGGMRQRIAIARSLAQNAPILLMDEPFGALDEITRANQQDMLLKLWQTGGLAAGGVEKSKTVLFVTHDVEEALILSSRVILLAAHPGRIVHDIKVDLPRPRSHNSVLYNSRFTELRNGLLDKLNRVVTEAMR
ncbi:MAG: ABC transporter ATP-binding protein [Spirochaetaceae bacterium]|jgi:ABC-type nitrate/sulfonate/bicarbonate transport system ATPase subunit|nr:ABC transporter ATP-binding protein [Spirochaetaceae bacterium]